MIAKLAFAIAVSAASLLSNFSDVPTAER